MQGRTKDGTDLWVKFKGTGSSIKPGVKEGKSCL